MLAQLTDIGQMAVAPLAVARLHRQLRAAVDDAQRGAYVVGNRQDDFLAHIQQVAVLADNLFQLALSGLPPPDVPLDDDIRKGKQQDSHAQYAGQYAERGLPHVGYSFFPEVESHLRLPVQQGDKRRQFAVQLSVLPTQAVHRGVEIELRRVFQGGYLAVQRMQVIRRRIYPYRVLLAEEARDAFLAPYLYAGLARTFDDRRQPAGDQAVHLLPLADALHDAQQVRLFGRQQHPQRIDLFGAHEADALTAEREQQAVETEPLGAVGAEILLVPAYDALAQGGEFRNLTVGNGYILTNVVYFNRVCRNLLYPALFIQQNGDHNPDDRH